MNFMRINCINSWQLKDIFISIIIFSFVILLEFYQEGIFYIDALHYKLLGTILLCVLGRHLFHNTFYGTTCLLLLIIYINMVYSIILFLGFSIDMNKIIGTEVFICSIVNIFLVLINLFKSKLWTFISILFTIMLFFITLVFACYYFAENNWLSGNAILAIMQTNSSEAWEYMLGHLSINSSVALIIVVIAITMLIRHTFKYGGLLQINKKTGTFVVLFLLLNIIQTNNSTKYSYFIQPFKDAYAGLEDYNNFANMRENRKTDLAVNVVREDNLPGVYVLVIGESQTKEHMSAYGYGRKTTPWLDNALTKGDIILFKNAYSCHAHTISVLSYALTEKNQYNSIKLETCASIIEYANSAGFDTAWLSNQVHYGIWDTPVSVIADSSQQQKWINSNIGKTTDTDYYDEKLIDELGNIKLHDNILIVIHMMGSHGGYSDRYPSTFSTFGRDSLVDEYDNTILYNDYCMERMLDKIKNLPNFMGMLYFADHGDDADNELYHNADNLTAPMIRIPLYVALSDEYKKRYPNRYSMITKASEYTITNDLVFNMLFSIMGIKDINKYEPENDPLSLQYNSTRERFKTIHGKKQISDFE